MVRTVCVCPDNSIPPIHQVIFDAGLDPIAIHSISYARSADSGWLLNIISTERGRTGMEQQQQQQHQR